MGLRLAEKITLICLLVLAMIFGLIFGISISIGLLLGGIAGFIAYRSSKKQIETLSFDGIVNLRRKLRFNLIFRQIIYIIVLMIGIIFPDFANIFAILGGIMIVKIGITIEAYKLQEGGGVNE